MNKENKNQLILICVIMSMVLYTLINWYPQFVFHTFKEPDVKQYFMSGENKDFKIDGYEFFYDEQQYYGNAVLSVKTENMILKSDIIELSFKSDNHEYTHKIKVKKSAQELKIPFVQTHSVIQSLSDGDMNIKITRKKKVIYNETIDFITEPFVILNGMNKDYLVQNISVTSNVLKTGVFSSSIKDLSEKYPYMEIDYLVSNQNELESYNEAIRFIHMKGETKEFLDNKISEKQYFYEGNLLEKNIVCVVSLLKSEDDQEPYVFKLDLTQSVKEVSYE